jgi:23S rRNA G2069 N7-methylase RlmK/C1962 C5-methylase RlmI
MDALDCAKMFREKGELFDVVLLDPPYSYRKSMELYNGNKNSRFKQLLDVIRDILTPHGGVITFGYHSRVMSGKRGFRVREICLISHGGAQHDTIAVVEERVTVTGSYQK